jgi:membrane fusion protein (multidrug efflux system)
MRKRIALISLALVLGAGAVYYFSASEELTNNAYVQGEVTALAPKVAGYVVEVLVADNAKVRKGDLLFRIDDKDYRIKVARAKAEAQAAAATVANQKAQIKLQEKTIIQAEANLLAAAALFKQKDQDFNRRKRLLPAKAITAQEFEEAERERTQAEAARLAAEAELAVQTVKMEVLAAAVAAAEAVFSQAQESLKLAQLDLENAEVRAPISGVVGDRKVQVGRYLNPGVTVLRVIPLDTLWVVANFKETQMANLKVGQTAMIEVDGYEGTPLTGRVDSFSPGSGATFSLLAPDNATGNFVRVVQRVPVKITLLTNPLQDRLVPGLSLKVRVKVRGKASDLADQTGLKLAKRP